ncbi:extracellular matrix regulator RemB [Paenibacillus senegalensis]|uniref:extracellular matrix regulator RemB n=1 Tax=Paenibacillus senegalensis TaxID=1465766 RepID=UPI0002884279|nr:extracellular matrix/biofilm biosynthesis regulator RemA family protein [Paenibacillus senegalensis]
MFIHLGGEKIIRANELVAIFDLAIEKNSKISKRFIKYAEKHRKIEVIGEEESKSLIITANKVYYSPISTSTLNKRAHQLTMN